MKLLLLDDSEELLELLGAMLAADPRFEQVHQAASAARAAQLAAEHAIDVFVVDESLGDSEGSGTDFIERTRAARPAARFLLVTGFKSWKVAARSLLRGADGFVVKPSVGKRLTNAILAVAADECYLDPEMVPELVAGLRGKAPGADGQKLTDDERDVLDGLERRETNAEIARRRGVPIAIVKGLVKALCAKAAAGSGG